MYNFVYISIFIYELTSLYIYIHHKPLKIFLYKHQPRSQKSQERDYEMRVANYTRVY